MVIDFKFDDAKTAQALQLIANFAKDRQTPSKAASLFQMNQDLRTLTELLSEGAQTHQIAMDAGRTKNTNLREQAKKLYANMRARESAKKSELVAIGKYLDFLSNNGGDIEALKVTEAKKKAADEQFDLSAHKSAIAKQVFQIVALHAAHLEAHLADSKLLKDYEPLGTEAVRVMITYEGIRFTPPTDDEDLIRNRRSAQARTHNVRNPRFVKDLNTKVDEEIERNGPWHRQ